MTQRFRIETLSSAHDRAGFLSGVEPLDRYLRDLATQDIKRRVSDCFVALDDDDVIAGYYTFAATSLPLTEVSPEERERLPRYASAPAGLIGRLAVDQRFQGRRLGGTLVMDAVARAATQPSSPSSSTPRTMRRSASLSIFSFGASPASR